MNILDNYNKERFIEYLSIKTVDNKNTGQMATELMIIYEKIKKMLKINKIFTDFLNLFLQNK